MLRESRRALCGRVCRSGCRECDTSMGQSKVVSSSLLHTEICNAVRFSAEVSLVGAGFRSFSMHLRICALPGGGSDKI